MCTSQPELTASQEKKIEQMAINRVREMNNDDVICNAIDLEINQMEQHIKDFFYKRLKFHQKKAIIIK